jgi:hypothetical protein
MRVPTERQATWESLESPFEVNDTDAIYKGLRTRGDIEFLGQPATVRSPTKGSLRILTFKDPHGIILELIEHRQTSD